MADKFKKGDVVVCVNAMVSNLTVNKEYTIASYNNTLDGVYLVNDTGIESFYCATRFVLKEQPAPTREAILSEAEKSPEVKGALKRLFPEMFNTTETHDLLNGVEAEMFGLFEQPAIVKKGYALIRVCGKNRFFLLPDYEWEIEDSHYLVISEK